MLLFILNFPVFLQAEVSISAEGVIKAGPATDSCGASTEGGIRWSSTNTCLEACYGAVWQCVQLTVCGDTLPDTISFTSLINQSTSTLVTSNIVQVTGIPGCVVEVTISGEGSPQYRTCSNSSCSTIIQDWTASKGNISENDYIQVRMTTNAAGAVENIANLVVGSRNANFSTTTTGNCADASPPVGTVCADGSVYIGITPDGSVKMYTTRCRGGQTWSGSACTGSALQLKWSVDNNINNGINNYNTGEANSAAIVALSNADGPYEAANYCDGLNIHGQTDWYLPARNEAALLASACDLIENNGCSSSQELWTSTETSATNSLAWEGNGTIANRSKPSTTRLVRCVRK